MFMQCTEGEIGYFNKWAELKLTRKPWRPNLQEIRNPLKGSFKNPLNGTVESLSSVQGHWLQIVPKLKSEQEVPKYP